MFNEIMSEVRELREKSKMFNEESKVATSQYLTAYYEGKAEAYGNAAESLSNLLTELRLKEVNYD